MPSRCTPRHNLVTLASAGERYSASLDALHARASDAMVAAAFASARGYLASARYALAVGLPGVAATWVAFARTERRKVRAFRDERRAVHSYALADMARTPIYDEVSK